MQELLAKLRSEFPDLRFMSGKQFYWSPETREIFYNDSASGDQARWSLLHETGHALLEHQHYQADFELLKLEIAAWQQARKVAEQFNITIDDDHIEDCLDTYRDWLYKRSICPTCASKCLQQDHSNMYRCFNCHTTWRVGADRFCRTYRATKNVAQAPVAFRLQAD